MTTSRSFGWKGANGDIAHLINKLYNLIYIVKVTKYTMNKTPIHTSKEMTVM